MSWVNKEISEWKHSQGLGLESAGGRRHLGPGVSRPRSLRTPTRAGLAPFPGLRAAQGVQPAVFLETGTPHDAALRAVAAGSVEINLDNHSCHICLSCSFSAFLFFVSRAWVVLTSVPSQAVPPRLPRRPRRSHTPAPGGWRLGGPQPREGGAPPPGQGGSLPTERAAGVYWASVICKVTVPGL